MLTSPARRDGRLVRRFTKLGLLVMEIQRAPDASIVIRQGGSEQRLLVL